MFKLACVLACLSFGLVNSASFITPCASGDRACLKQSAQAVVPIFAQGIPELGIESLDPMHLDKIQASQAGLDMDFRDTTVTGLKGCTITVKRDKTKNKMNMEYTCDVTITGDYTLGGRLLILPIEGNGKYKIKVKQIVIKLTYDMAESSGADGQKHWHIASWKHSFNVLKNAEFRFHNLFNGNKQLSDTIHTFANTNWKDIMNEISPPVVRAIVTKIVDATEIFFSKVPVSELALD